MTKQVIRLGVLALIALAMTTYAAAQVMYPPGTTGTTTGTGTYSPTGKSYGSGAKIGAAIGAGAGAGILFYAIHHHHAQAAKVVGCVAPDGKTITADKGNKTYQLEGTPLAAGEKLAVLGKKTKSTGGENELEVLQVQEHLGQCSQQGAAAGQ